jgi:uncharacterized protein (TIGR03435 family)
MIERFASKLDFRSKLLAITLVVMGASTSGAFGQADTPPTAEGALSTATFDVASIRENIKPIDRGTHIYRHPDDGQFVAINASMRSLLQFAFDMPDAQILNAPEWLGSRNFDVEAKADMAVDDWMRTLDSDHAKAAKEKMVQALLADRFRLVVHRETRELPVYVLVVAKGGAKLQEAKGGAHFGGSRGEITDQGASIATLADQLSRVVGRPVVDKTGLAGRFDLTLKWTPESGAPQADSDGPSIFTAIQEQLGLKLESAKAPVPVLVIDHVEMPSAN